MAEILCFVIGVIAGWFAAGYRDKLLKVKETIQKEFDLK